MLLFFQLNVVEAFLFGIDALVMVVNRDRQHPLGDILTDDILVKIGGEITRRQNIIHPHRLGFGSCRSAHQPFVAQNVLTQHHAFVTDKNTIWPSDEPLNQIT